MRDGEGDWSRLADQDPYIRDRLIYHLSGALDIGVIERVATDAAYVTMRMFLDGVHAAETDVRAAIGTSPGNDALAWLLRLLRQAGHLFAGHADVASEATTMLSRLQGAPAGATLIGLRPLLPEHVLVPRAPIDEVPALDRVLEGHTDSVRALVFSPDGTRLASAGDDGMVRLWDSRTLRLVSQLRIGLRIPVLVWGNREIAVASDRNVVILVETACPYAVGHLAPLHSTRGHAWAGSAASPPRGATPEE